MRTERHTVGDGLVQGVKVKLGEALAVWPSGQHERQQVQQLPLNQTQQLWQRRHYLLENAPRIRSQNATRNKAGMALICTVL